jgi:hypothetical protein
MANNASKSKSGAVPTKLDGAAYNRMFPTNAPVADPKKRRRV